jgi:hypothetical protein
MSFYTFIIINLFLFQSCFYQLTKLVPHKNNYTRVLKTAKAVYLTTKEMEENKRQPKAVKALI